MNRAKSIDQALAEAFLKAELVDGRVKARFVDPDFRHRMRTEDIVNAVREAAQN